MALQDTRTDNIENQPTVKKMYCLIFSINLMWRKLTNSKKGLDISVKGEASPRPILKHVSAHVRTCWKQAHDRLLSSFKKHWPMCDNEVIYLVSGKYTRHGILIVKIIQSHFLRGSLKSHSVEHKYSELVGNVLQEMWWASSVFPFTFSTCILTRGICAIICTSDRFFTSVLITPFMMKENQHQCQKVSICCRTAVILHPSPSNLQTNKP